MSIQQSDSTLHEYWTHTGITQLSHPQTFTDMSYLIIQQKAVWPGTALHSNALHSLDHIKCPYVDKNKITLIKEYFRFHNWLKQKPLFQMVNDNWPVFSMHQASLSFT